MNKFIKLSVAAALSSVTLGVAAQTEIQWWHAMGGKNGELIQGMADQFNASQDKYAVKPIFKGSYAETMTAAIAAFRAKQQPAIVQVYEVGTATMMYAKGAIYPVEKLMKDNDQPFDRAAFVPAVTAYYSSPEGELLSMPFNSSTPVLWYNQDALTKAGVSKVPTTWNEVSVAAQKLVDSGMKCGMSVGFQSWVLIENYSAWHNLPIGTLENGFGGLNSKLEFNNEHVKNRLAILQDWTKDKRFVYGGRAGASLPMFTNGECGMWMNSSAYYGSIKSQAKFNFGQTMMPLDTDVTDAPQNSIIGGATLWVMQGRPKVEYPGVAEFLAFLASPEVQSDWAMESGYVPITKAASEVMTVQGFYANNPGTDTAVKELSLNPPTPNSKGLRFGNFVQIRDVINEEMEGIWSGNKTADQAMDSAVERGNKLLRRFEKSVQ